MTLLLIVSVTWLIVFYTGGLAIAVANPTDLVKVRLQAEGKLAAGVPRRYTGALNAYSTIIRQVVCNGSLNFFMELKMR